MVVGWFLEDESNTEWILVAEEVEESEELE